MAADDENSNKVLNAIAKNASKKLDVSGAVFILVCLISDIVACTLYETSSGLERIVWMAVIIFAFIYTFHGALKIYSSKNQSN